MDGSPIFMALFCGAANSFPSLNELGRTKTDVLNTRGESAGNCHDIDNKRR